MNISKLGRNLKIIYKICQNNKTKIKIKDQYKYNIVALKHIKDVHFANNNHNLSN